MKTFIKEHQYWKYAIGGSFAGVYFSSTNIWNMQVFANLEKNESTVKWLYYTIFAIAPLQFDCLNVASS